MGNEGEERALRPAEALQETLNYRFRDLSLLQTALTNPSYRSTHPEIPAEQNNQRLEFLGDAVLGLLSAEQLYHRHQSDDEGSLTRLRSHLVSGQALASLARRIDLGAYLLLGKGEALRDGREHDKYLRDGLEALFGAIWVDGGWPAVSAVYAHLRIGEDPVAVGDLLREENPKGAVQIIVQRHGWPDSPRYELVSSEGPAHAPEFVVRVSVSIGLSAEGRGRNKHMAEVEAARRLLPLLPKDDEPEKERGQSC
ncbi:MAG: ribonuclease III [Kiritimatiellae bacterium]|nr:ribonuclease III [Kiritimatiellia bacterium]